MDDGQRLIYRIDAAFAQNANEDGKRKHLGASVIGRKCLREVWFSFRWAGAEPSEGRMLRLFSRGHAAEEKFAELLRGVGANVWTHDPITGKQFLVTAHGGHFGGSLDGVATNLPDFPHGSPETPVLLEFKTHNDKSFKQLLSKGLAESKPQHINQAQIYMHGMGLKWCLYMAVNKNDDHLFIQYFAYDEQKATHLLNRAESVLFGTGIPSRITNNPTWFECRFCDFYRVCWKQRDPDRNCRTCRFAIVERDGSWSCQGNMEAIKTSPKIGCEHYQVNPDI